PGPVTVMPCTIPLVVANGSDAPADGPVVASTITLAGPDDPTANSCCTARMNAAMRAAVLPGWVNGGSQVGFCWKNPAHCSAVTDASVTTVGGAGIPGSDARKFVISVPSAVLNGSGMTKPSVRADSTRERNAAWWLAAAAGQKFVSSSAG